MPTTFDQRPLALTADERLLDDLVRLASVAGVELDVVPDAGAARRSWPRASLVVVGADLVDALARAAPPRRGNVYVAGHDLGASSIWPQAIALGADHVVDLPGDEARLVEALADAAEGASRDAVVVGVIGGCGGAGASTLAAGLGGLAASGGHATLLVDADPLGGGIDLVLGGEEQPGVRWPDFVATRGRLSAAALADAVARVGRLGVLSWDRDEPRELPVEAMRAVLDAACRGNSLVVVDLPRGLDDAAVAAVRRCTMVVLVVPARVRAVASAGRVARSLGPLVTDLRLLVRGPAPAGLDAAVVAEALELPLAGELAPEPDVDRMLERGEAPGRRHKSPLAAFCREFVSELIEPEAA